MNRRNLLTAAPAAGFAALVASSFPVEAMAETPVMAAFREWNALYRFIEDGADTMTQTEFDAACDRRREMERHLATIPSVGVADFAAKVLALTNHGDHDLDKEATPPEFWAEARALVGA